MPMPTIARLLLSLVLFIPAVALPAAEVDFAIRMQRDLGGAPLYSAEVRPLWSPTDPSTPYNTLLVTSADHQFSITSVGGWVNPPPSYFSSLSDLLTAVQQPWEVHVDAGLPTQHDYTMSLNLGSYVLPTFAPPSISVPTYDQTIGTLSPTFAFTLNTPDFYYADLFHFIPSTSVFDAREALNAGTSSWSPPVTLSPGTEYFLDLYNGIAVLDMGFTIPLDGNGDPLANFHSIGGLDSESTVRFTVVPEPAGVALLMLGLPVLVGGRWHRQRRVRSALAP